MFRTKVPSSDDKVHLFEPFLTYVGGKKTTGRDVEGEAPRISQTVGPYFRKSDRIGNGITHGDGILFS